MALMTQQRSVTNDPPAAASIHLNGSEARGTGVRAFTHSTHLTPPLKTIFQGRTNVNRGLPEVNTPNGGTYPGHCGERPRKPSMASAGEASSGTGTGCPNGAPGPQIRAEPAGQVAPISSTTRHNSSSSWYS